MLEHSIGHVRYFVLIVKDKVDAISGYLQIVHSVVKSNTNERMVSKWYG